MSVSFLRQAVYAVFLLLAFCAVSKSAFAELGITPTQVLFEGRDRFKDVTLFNPGNETKTYNVSWEFYRMMGGDSDLIYGPSAGSTTELDLTKYVVFTPRRVTLAPGGRQKIRLALRRPKDVPIGEYRAHLKFSPLLEDETRQKSSEGFSAAIDIRVGFSIPVVFQNGDMDVKANIESLAFERNQQSGALEAFVKISRQGIHGSLGVIEAFDERGEKIGSLSNAHIFPEVGSRKFKLVLKEENLSGQSIRLVYRHFDNNKNIVYAERSFPIQ